MVNDYQHSSHIITMDIDDSLAVNLHQKSVGLALAELSCSFILVDSDINIVVVSPLEKYQE